MIKSLLFPTACAICDKGSRTLCSDCYEALKNRNLKISKSENSSLKYLIYLVDYDSMHKKFIHKGKYSLNREVWQIIGSLLNDKLEIKSNSIITYVPLHWMRYCKRGFNQSKLIAERIGKPVSLIKRVKNNSSFTMLSASERIVKSCELFEVRNKDLSNVYTCYLIDDVVTTRATLEACASLLKQKYPHIEVIGISFAKTPKHSEFMVV